LEGVKGPHEAAQEDKTMTTNNMTVKFIANEKGNSPGKLADAELHFTGGPLEGLKLIGFAIWERRSGGGRNVTFPARQYSVNGERRSFALLRPINDTAAQDRIRDFILESFAIYEEELVQAS
jgi:sporulation protein YlmC with PRC-barrel domain